MTTPSSSRLEAIDALRGLVILIMLLDHVRETFYLHHQVSDPMQIAGLDPALFFSRSLAHLCAPVFVLLTGLSAYLYQSKINSLAQTQAFLVKRGLFLIVLELVVINFAWTAQFPPQVIYLQVIWAIGVSMVALACLISLPKIWLWCLAGLIIFGHNLLDGIQIEHPFWQPLWYILHQRGWIECSEQLKLRSSYPVLPWIGVILFGYCLGLQFFAAGQRLQQSVSKLAGMGVASVLLFVLLRMLDMYGDQAQQPFSDFSGGLMSFFNLSKYPPSLDFILLNCGLGLILLWLCYRVQHQVWIKPLLVFGSVPMFFYIVHLYLLKLLYFIAVSLFGTNHGQYFGVDQVLSLWLISAVLIVVLYPLMQWFSQFKRRNHHIHWLKYL
jgi:uncharacterized membrane protein